MGLKLKIKRIEKGIKQCELAERVGISRYSLSALERDKIKSPKLEVMKKIAKVLDTSVTELFFSEEE
ncbi:helix-turn-helix transcriptional regulator [Clostridium sp.]|uniref:helix-turn-helix transcriptional regulator n=1 Tax=Clostridium sp. TaxID=1506 RepID=UPI0025BD9E25|nr:helix-turn-helix transcriptional regulator [Clostridium sp.]